MQMFWHAGRKGLGFIACVRCVQVLDSHKTKFGFFFLFGMDWQHFFGFIKRQRQSSNVLKENKKQCPRRYDTRSRNKYYSLKLFPFACGA